jgi:hypothetical protein
MLQTEDLVTIDDSVEESENIFVDIVHVPNLMSFVCAFLIIGDLVEHIKFNVIRLCLSNHKRSRRTHLGILYFILSSINFNERYSGYQVLQFLYIYCMNTQAMLTGSK